jgi:hypothetical protein
MKSSVFFMDDAVKQEYFALALGKTEDHEVSALLDAAFEDIADNAFCGVQVPKRLIPKVYRDKYGIDNLWKYNLSRSWRLLYSVAGDGPSVAALIIEWLPHKK